MTQQDKKEPLSHYYSIGSQGGDSHWPLYDTVGVRVWLQGEQGHRGSPVALSNLSVHPQTSMSMLLLLFFFVPYFFTDQALNTHLRVICIDCITHTICSHKTFSSASDIMFALTAFAERNAKKSFQMHLKSMLSLFRLIYFSHLYKNINMFQQMLECNVLVKFFGMFWNVGL